MAEICSLSSFLPLFSFPRQENHGAMEIFGIALVVLILISIAATFTAVARDGRGHTPPEYSIRDWSALDLPSRNHTTRAL
jgi:hypothetical protein